MRHDHWIKIEETRGQWGASPAARRILPHNGRIVIVIHGYNNDPREAGRSYRRFYSELASVVSHK
jgi:hypothetical protein